MRQRQASQHLFATLAVGAVLLACCFVPRCGAQTPKPAPTTAQADPLPSSPFSGKTIASISYQPSNQPFPLAQLERINPLKIGDVFEAQFGRSSIEALFETGRFSDITIEAQLTANGEVELVYKTQPSWFVGRVAMSDVSDPPNESQLASSTKLELGQDFSEDYMLEATENVMESLRKNGFYRTSVSPRTFYDPTTQQVNLTFDIAFKNRARLARPEVQGDPQRSVNSLIRASHWQRLWGLAGWKHLTEQRLQNGLDRIRNVYLKQDYLMANVQLQGLRYLEAQNAVQPILRIQSGSRVRVDATGARLSLARLRPLVPVFQERSVDRDLLREGARNIRSYFQGKGYFDTEVDFETQEKPNPDTGFREQVITFAIDRGLRYKLVHLEIRGNKYFDTELLRERMNITPATRLRYRNGRFSEELLAKDRASIEALYKTNGFREAKVSSYVEKNYGGKEDLLAVYLEVQEGPQWFVEDLELEGVDLRIYEQIRRSLSAQPGQPFSESTVAIDRDYLLNYYYDNGYPEARFEFQFEPGTQPNNVRLRYTMVEGRRNFVRKVIVDGYRETRPGLILDRITLREGQPLSQSEMIDAQRRLYDLGIFAKVDVAIQNPNGKEREKYVLYRLEEARRYSFTFGFGAQIARIGGGTTTLDAPQGAPGFSPRVSLGLTRTNFLGIGHTVGIRAQYSNFQERAAVNYFAPQFRGTDRLNLNFGTLFDRSRDVRTFTSERLESSIQLGQRFSRATSTQYRFAYRRVGIVDGTLQIDPALIPIFSTPVRVGMLSGTWINDRRDDPLDSRRGFYTTADFGLASQVFGSQSGFFRTLIRNSSYHPIGRDLTLARNVTLGTIYGFRGFNRTLEEAIDLGVEVPLPERFFGGGGVSHRGFPDNQAGPRDLRTGFPIGGKALFMHSLELRFPLLGDSLGGVLFHDAGNVYSAVNQLSFRLRQNDIKDFDYMVHAIGMGFRYRTPVGPVRFDLAYSPNAPQFFGFQGSRQELIQGGGSSVVQRINRFQFHFSLGQTF